MRNARVLTLLFIVFVSMISAGSCPGQQSSRSTVVIGDPVDDMLILRSRIGDQLYLYREVMVHIKEISRQFSDGFVSPDEALRRITLLRHAYNNESEPVPSEAAQLSYYMNRMFSRLENYFIHFKRVYREDPYLNARVAETKFYVSREAERLEYMYLK